MRGLGVMVLVAGLAQGAEGPLSIAVNDADLKDVLRAATADTDLNLVFEPGLETRAQGLNLKAVSLDELLKEVLPRLGLSCTRQGRTLFIRRSGEGLRFYPVEHLAMARNGSKSFQVNASGQVVQAPGAGGGSATNTSAYTSSVRMDQASDPWADLESGLRILVFGAAGEVRAAPGQPPGSRGFAAGGRFLLIQPHPGLVAVDADPATHERVAAYLEAVRRRVERQVLLEARIVEVTLGEDCQTGVDWNGLLSGGNGSFFHAGGAWGEGDGFLRLVARSGRVEATLSALARDHRLTVLSAPRLSALNNQKAVLRVVREEAYVVPSSQITPGTAAGGAVATGQITPMIVPVGIILDIQPQIGGDGVITLAVNPSISEVAEERSFSLPNPAGGRDLSSTRLPVVDRRDLDTVVRVRSGETLVLAGIIRTREADAGRGVPWLRKVPVLGRLFSWRRKEGGRTELAIFITPTLMEEEGQKP